MTDMGEPRPDKRGVCWCRDLPSAFSDKYLTDVAAVAANVEELDGGHPDEVLWRCLVCGQLWRSPVPGPGLFKVPQS